MGQRSDYGKGSYIPSDLSEKPKRSEEKERNTVGHDDTIYRYLCPSRKIGSIIGIGGDIANQLRAQTRARIRISENIPGCDERVVTIYSPSEETNGYDGNDEEFEHGICPAQDALFRVHDKVVAEESNVNVSFEEEPVQVFVRLLVPSDQIGCVIGKAGQIIQGMRNETGAQIRILGSEHLPPCALSSDQLVQINGQATVVKKALYQVAFRLHDNPSRSQESLLSLPSIYRSGIAFNNPHAGGASLMGSYGNYRNDGRDWSSTTREFTLRLVCPTENLGTVIGKGGATIKQIRQESGAFIVVDSAGADGDDSIVSVSSKEMFEAPSRTIDAILRLQPRCSERIERETGDFGIITRLLVSSQKVGCIIGKGGAIIKEMRSTSRANICIFSDENIPKVALDDDEMVQITGDMKAARDALLQIMQRLRANLFEINVNSLAFPMPAPYATSADSFNGQKYGRRDNRTRNSGYQNYSSRTLPQGDGYGCYGESQVVGAYGAYSPGPADASYGEA